MAPNTRNSKKIISGIIQRLKPYLITTSVVLGLALIAVVVIGMVAKVRDLTRSAQIYDYRNRAEEEIVAERYPEAFMLLQEARNLDPGNNDLIIRQADIAFLNGDFKVAQTLYQQASKFESAEIIFYNGLRSMSDTDLASAVEYFLLSIETITDASVLEQSRVEQLLQKVNETKNIENEPLREATLAKLLIEQRAYFEAETLLGNLLAKQPMYRDAHYLLGVTYLNLGKDTLAQESLNKALSIDPNYEPARQLLR